MAAAAPLTRLRENSHLPAEGWSNWEKAMVPPDVVSSNLELRETLIQPFQVGFICSSIRNAFPDKAQHGGIYEWRAKGTKPGQPNHVIYIGSTCRSKPGALIHRILEYCTNGSHKKDLINDALRRGYELQVRVKVVEGMWDPVRCIWHPCKEVAENEENKLLATYNYAWNKRSNGQIRDILPF